MADAVILPVQADVLGGPIHQVLHGYSEGHKLLESSIKLPDDVSRLMLRLSDLSGSNVTSGFEDYLTGYPLGSSGLYALAKTWHAPEVPRPGCVWTHTLVLTKEHLESPSLLAFLVLFRRPKHREAKGTYQQPISIVDNNIETPQSSNGPDLTTLLAAYYRKSFRPILVPAQSATECTYRIFCLWAQQWPALRRELTFSTGSLGARSVGGKPFDLQCVPVNQVRDVQLEMQSSPGVEPVILTSTPADLPSVTSLLADDAVLPVGGDLRAFLWAAAESGSTRSDLLSFAQIFAAIERSDGIDLLLAQIVENFPLATQATNLKRMLFGPHATQSCLKQVDEKHILALLGATEHFAAFDAGSLKLRERGEALSGDSDAARWLIAQLFRSPLNPLSGEILVGLISSLDPQSAHAVTSEQPRFLSTLVDIKPSLATSSQLWVAAGDRRRELLAVLERQENLPRDVIDGVIHALLESQSDSYIRKAFEIWGAGAVHGALDWIDKNPEAMTEVCRGALTFYVKDALDWIEKTDGRSTPTIIALAKVVAPYSYQFCNRNTRVWQRAFADIRSGSSDYDRLFMAAFLLALGLGNAPSEPRVLIEKSFELIYRAAWDDRIDDRIWQILDPIVDHLPWPNDWDKCERISRGLVSSFLKYHWPAKDLSRCITAPDILERILKSAKKVDGGKVFKEDFRS